MINNKKVMVGNKSFIDSVCGGNSSNNNNTMIENDIDKFESLGKTVIIVSIDDLIVGLISLSDTLKPEAKKVISKLKSNNNIKVWLVSGDNKKATLSIGNELNIDSNKIIGSALPMDKFNIIKELQNGGNNIVAMVGDGINDSLGLVQSDVGFSFTSSTGGSTDIAIESADIILLKNDLNDILVSIDLSKSIFNTIKFNLFWAFIYNLIGIPSSSGILYPFGLIIPPALAGISELASHHYL